MGTLSDEIKEKGKEIFQGKYDYLLLGDVKTKKEKFPIICPEHGVFYKSYDKHIRSRQGCPECSGKKRYTTEEFITKCQKLEHTTEMSFENTHYVNTHTKIKVFCHHKDDEGVEHGEFEITPLHLLTGEGCPKCRYIKSAAGKRRSITEVVDEAKKVHGDRYDYSLITDYRNDRIKYPIICAKHGVFYQTMNNHIKAKQDCPKCISDKSVIEKGLFEYIQSLLPDVEIEENNRSILNGKEIDVYIPSLKLGFEMNGLIWHSDKYEKDENYHLNKTELALEKETTLIHIFEDEWLEKNVICKSRIKTILGVSDRRIFARKCEVKLVSFLDASRFLIENHLQGFTPSSINTGLYYQGELVAVMTFGKKNSDYELIRLCSKINTIVVGGASKMLNFFIKLFEPESIITYVDRRWSSGNVYKKLGFALNNLTKPSYSYVLNKKRVKYNDSNQGLSRIYDCGKLCYIWKK